MTPSPRPYGRRSSCTAPASPGPCCAFGPLRPHSSAAWTMNGWAHQVDGEPEQARNLLRRALELDPDNDEATQLLDNLPPP